MSDPPRSARSFLDEDSWSIDLTVIPSRLAGYTATAAKASPKQSCCRAGARGGMQEDFFYRRLCAACRLEPSDQASGPKPYVYWTGRANRRCRRRPERPGGAGSGWSITASSERPRPRRGPDVPFRLLASAIWSWWTRSPPRRGCRAAVQSATARLRRAPFYRRSRRALCRVQPGNRGAMSPTMPPPCPSSSGPSRGRSGSQRLPPDRRRCATTWDCSGGSRP